jgi:hypothetical protein
VIEEKLLGGNSGSDVVLRGDVVHRRGPQNDLAVALLRYLESIGFPYAPRYLGVDESGREMLSYIPGSTTDHPSQRSIAAYAAGGAMLRSLHDATAGHPLAGGAECVIHADAGPFNTIFQNGHPVAFIDWEHAQPGARLHDLGYLAWTWCIQTQGNVPLDDQARHLRQLCDGYGDVAADDLLDAMIEAQSRVAKRETAIADDPAIPDTRRAHAEWASSWARSNRSLVIRERARFRTVLNADHDGIACER